MNSARRNRHTNVLVLLFSALLAGCGLGNSAALDDTVTSVGPDGRGQALIASIDTDSRWPRDPITIDKASIVNDSLVVAVRHGGGCARHTYQLVVSSAWMESQPVQVPARISHNARGDLCKALLRSELRFSLLPVARTYSSSYQQQHGSVIFRLDGWTEGLLYSF